MSRLPPRFVRNPPGSSCATCRRRRIHCDRARPGCSQCSSGAYICPGYGASLRWVLDAHLPARTPANPPSEIASEDRGLLMRYFEHAAPVMGIFHDCRNPFGDSLRQSILDEKNKTLRHAAMAVAAMQQAGCDGSYLQRAWRHRATACRLLNRDLSTQQWRLTVLTTVILLGLTEACFDMNNNLPFHVLAARALLSEIHRLGYLVPPVLCNAVLWMEVQVSFVYDPPGDLDAVNGGSLPQATADPFLINTAWEPLFRQIGLAGALTTQARQRNVTKQTQDAAREVYTELLSMRLDASPYPAACSAVCSPDAQSRAHCLHMGEAHRLGAAALLQYYFPALTSMVDTGAGDLVALVMLHLRAIPLSCTLWHVSAIPVLSVGQFAQATSDRDFIRAIMQMLTHKTLMSPLRLASQLLEECWRCRDKGREVTWNELMAGRGLRAMMN